MIVVSKPLGGLFSVADLGLSDVLSVKRGRGRERLKDRVDTRTRPEHVL